MQQLLGDVSIRYQNHVMVMSEGSHIRYPDGKHVLGNCWFDVDCLILSNAFLTIVPKIAQRQLAI